MRESIIIPMVWSFLTAWVKRPSESSITHYKKIYTQNCQVAPIFQTMCQHIFQAYSKQFKLHKTGWRVYIYLLSLDREISSNCLECTRYTMVHFPSICSNQLYDEKRFPLWHFLPSFLHDTQLRCVAGGVDFFFPSLEPIPVTFETWFYIVGRRNGS